MYIGSGKTSEKEKENIIKLAKANNLSGLRRNYEFHTSLFSGFFIALIIFFFDLMRKMITEQYVKYSIFLVDLTILIFIGVLWIAVSNSRDKSFFAIKIKENKLEKSKKKAYELIDSYAIKIR